MNNLDLLKEACQAPIFVFDFDGVIVRGSESIKREAWYIIAQELVAEGHTYAFQTLEDVRIVASEVRTWTRYDILKELGNRLDVPENELGAFVMKRAERFDELVQAGIVSTGLHANDAVAIYRLAELRRLYINSATPEKELSRCVEKLEIADKFHGIYGDRGAQSKLLNLAMVSDENIRRPKPYEITFIGDSEGDFDAAAKFGCHFIGLSNDWNKWDWSRRHPIIFELSALLGYV